MTKIVTEHVNVPWHTADSTPKDNADRLVAGPRSISAPADSSRVTCTLVSLRSETGTWPMTASATASPKGKCGLADWVPPGSATRVAVMTTVNEPGTYGGSEGGNRKVGNDGGDVSGDMRGSWGGSSGGNAGGDNGSR